MQLRSPLVQPAIQAQPPFSTVVRWISANVGKFWVRSKTGVLQSAQRVAQRIRVRLAISLVPSRHPLSFKICLEEILESKSCECLWSKFRFGGLNSRFILLKSISLD
ncbi:uncharacterized protein LOC120069853 [Benincasa hispida]|uniref:uncharacterized protein LOC120069853 n=1 Tax=Benincasa hispida TaxID=102211 RepID=UPI001901C4D5|nr:uncharacterized protein LOC120069853 [Benincasa hispida]XP_038877597.1 uncharacterized protein LOC120069853 [Benincasa hispida]